MHPIQHTPTGPQRGVRAVAHALAPKAITNCVPSPLLHPRSKRHSRVERLLSLSFPIRPDYISCARAIISAPPCSGFLGYHCLVLVSQVPAIKMNWKYI